MVYDISEMLYDFAAHARPPTDGAFFSTTLPQVLNISADIINDFLQTRVATRFGLNPSRIHSHSLRFAGASALRASRQVEDTTIMIMGGWKSLAMLGYIKLASSVFEDVAAALSDRELFSVQDVRNLMPGVNF